VKGITAILVCFFLSLPLCGQDDSLKKKVDSIPDRIYLLQKVKRGGETLPEVEIKEVYIVAGLKPGDTRRSQSLFKKYERTVYNVKRVYPYALIVRERLEQVNADLTAIADDRGRRNYIKEVEKDVFGSYEDDMRRMTITQGRILIKLIDRETRNTSYDLIKQYRGGLTAAFWQGVARIFGTNLKEEYDAYGNDLLLELIVQEIEAGRL
jgi:hypothetical protein